MGRGEITSQAVWTSLPNSLQSLSMRTLSCGPPKGTLLPSLLQLHLPNCSCTALKVVFDAYPKLGSVNLRSLLTPRHEKEQADLKQIVQHSAWNLASSGGPNCSPVTHLREDEEWTNFGLALLPPPPFPPPGQVLAALPEMPNVTSFRFDFNFTAGMGDMLMYVNPLRLLYHIPRAFPNISHLRLVGVLSLETNLNQLHGCTLLHELEICSSDFVTGQALQRLAAVLPNLRRVQMIDCRRVSDVDKQRLAVQLQKNKGM